MAWWEGPVRDVRYSARRALASPGLSSAAILTLALGIGLDAGVFSVLNGMLFRPRVERDPQSFVHLVAPDQKFTLADYRAFRSANLLDELSGWSVVRVAVGDPALSDTLGLLVSCDFFSLYGLDRPVAGRVFTANECDESGASSVVVLSEQL
jgi:hypothetical protein